MQIAENTVASFHYTLTSPTGEVIDASPSDQPMAYLHGAGNIVGGLEVALEGHEPGDKFEVVVMPEAGYGVKDAELIHVVPRAAFQGVADIQPGMQFETRGGEGVGPMVVTVTAVDADNVTVDGNHPLAGETLHFAVEVTHVRPATAEELEHGHVHGAGGHHHH